MKQDRKFQQYQSCMKIRSVFPNTKRKHFEHCTTHVPWRFHQGEELTQDIPERHRKR